MSLLAGYDQPSVLQRQGIRAGQAGKRTGDEKLAPAEHSARFEKAIACLSPAFDVIR